MVINQPLNSTKVRCNVPTAFTPEMKEAAIRNVFEQVYEEPEVHLIRIVDHDIIANDVSFDGEDCECHIIDLQVYAYDDLSRVPLSQKCDIIHDTLKYRDALAISEEVAMHKIRLICGKS
jgi:hypothetical protein